MSGIRNRKDLVFRVFYHIKNRRDKFGADEIVRFHGDSGIERIRFRGVLLYFNVYVSHSSVYRGWVVKKKITSLVETQFKCFHIKMNVLEIHNDIVNIYQIIVWGTNPIKNKHLYFTFFLLFPFKQKSSRYQKLYTIDSVLSVCDKPYHMNNGFQQMWAVIKNLWNHALRVSDMSLTNPINVFLWLSL